MYLLHHLRDLYDGSSPGSVDYVLSRYLLINAKKLDSLTLTEIAKATAISKSAISKFVKKISRDEGYFQFVSSFQYELSYFISDRNKLKENAKRLKETQAHFQYIDDISVKQVVNALCAAKRIVFCGNSQYKNCFDTLINYLLLSGKDAKFSSWILYEQQKEELESLTSEDLLVIVEPWNTYYEFRLRMSTSVDMYPKLHKLPVRKLFLGRKSEKQKDVEVVDLQLSHDGYSNLMYLGCFGSAILSEYLEIEK